MIMITIQISDLDGGKVLARSMKVKTMDMVTADGKLRSYLDYLLEDDLIEAQNHKDTGGAVPKEQREGRKKIK